MPLDKSIKKVLVIGSGPIVIGQAAEFDYAGAQACRVLKEAGMNVVLVNSNPATIMTDKVFADEIYLEPLNAETIERIIEKERPDSLLAGLGGQTGLTVAMQLKKSGVLDRFGVRLIGTNTDAIDRAEDRKLFKETMDKIGEPSIPSEIANTVSEALSAAERIGYPVIIRPAFTLGGGGGGVANNDEEMRLAAAVGLDVSPITQILVEKYIFGYKEIEFETMRDSAGNCIAICSMENVDPVGVHTGDSIVVAPALTLSPKEYGMLRSASMKIVTELGIIGGCNCQFALDPESMEYYVIEVNPRVSRSSALASKATGYPIAKVTTKIALGYNLSEIANDITGKTTACFEPAIDYVVVKFPKWPFEKFQGSSRALGTQMKATGEVMAIGQGFEAALMKAIRGAEIGFSTLSAEPLSEKSVEERLYEINDRRIFTVFEALSSGISVEKIHEITKIDEFFIEKIKNLADFEAEIKGGLTEENYKRGKDFGYTDSDIEKISGEKITNRIKPVYKMVDTCAAEFAAKTPYFYSSIGERDEAQFFKGEKPVIMVLGSGPIRIGQGIEFDYSSVHCVLTLKQLGYEVVIVNNNPETVSTDYDTADRLYFEPLCFEDVMNIIEVEKPLGVVVAFGGQTAIKLTKALHESGIKIMGTSAESIDRAEDRELFDELLEKCGIKRPRGMGVKTLSEALSAAKELGYPVLLRPSYVIGGQNMKIVHDEKETETYMNKILATGIENPVLVDKYMMGTELEVDVISDGEDVLIPGIMEHIERAGIHSGDSIAVYPPFSINDRMVDKIVECSTRQALELGTKGLINIQYLIYDGELYVIEVNPRASRTVPYISKVSSVPMVDLATKVMVGEKLRDQGFGTGLYKTPPYVTVKVPVFSFEKLSDVNSYLGPEMKSTGEVLGIGKNLNEALFKGLTSAGMVVSGDPSRMGLFLSVSSHDQGEVISLAKKLLDCGFSIFATPETANTIKSLGIEATVVAHDGRAESVIPYMERGEISYIVYTGALMDSTMDEYIKLHRRAVQLGIPSFTSLDTANVLADIIIGRYNQQNTELVDINNMRTEVSRLEFAKMEATGDDYIFVLNFDGEVTCPESLCVTLCNRHKGIGGYGIVVLEPSAVADAKMRIFNRDSTEGRMAGNSIRSAGKLLYEKGYVDSDEITIETSVGVKKLKLYTRGNKVTFVSVMLGEADFSPASLPCTLSDEEIIDRETEIGDKSYRINCVSVGNPHCVVFCDNIDTLPVSEIGPLFENAPIFPDRTNTEFVKVINSTTLKMRAYERGNGETSACGTGAAAAVAAAVKNGYCKKNTDITVKVRGGDLTVNYSDEGLILSGDTVLIFEGVTEY